MEKIKVLIVDDHQIFRDGVLSLFSGVEEITIVGLASDGVEAIEKTRLLHPDVVILDISLPGISGIDVLKDITSTNGSNVLILSMHTKEEYVFKAISAGAKGYLPKEDTTKEELVNAVKVVARGDEYYTNSVGQIMQRYFMQKAKNGNPDNRKDYNALTKREKEILKLVVEGLSNQEIADKLFVNIRTIETHKTNIMNKLELKNTVELVKFAIKNRLVEI